jgi:beta-glucanase (GH16 family)
MKLISSIFMLCLAASPLVMNQVNGQDLKLVWSDEFNNEGLPDTTKWGYDVGDGCPDVCGWGNNELQYYTKSNLKNARVEDGVLIIEAHKESMRNKEYSSARLVTKNKGDWKYGRIEIRAQLPKGLGTWPAIWMLPTMPSGTMKWPFDGEIDIMEHVGYNQGKIFATIHTEKYNHIKWTQKSDSIIYEDASETMHTYAISWDEYKIEWLIDNRPFFAAYKKDEDKEGWPFDVPFHLILNVAVGGNWGGKMGIDDSIWPQKMLVDYVRVYQKID